MSGTSRDGVDAAAIVTDGVRVMELGPATTVPYSAEQAAALEAAVTATRRCALAKEEVPPYITAAACDALEAAEASALAKVAALVDRQAEFAHWPRRRLVGFHGHTLFHDPDGETGPRRTLQISRAAAHAARYPGWAVFHDFRSADFAAGGQGAPLAPVFHACMALHGPTSSTADTNRDCTVVINIGGVSNLTLVTEQAAELVGAPASDAAAASAVAELSPTRLRNALFATDAGPGNALLDDLVRAEAARRPAKPPLSGAPTSATEMSKASADGGDVSSEEAAAFAAGFDVDGGLASAGRADAKALRRWAKADVFASRPPPKSLDRDAYAFIGRETEEAVRAGRWTLADAAATLACFTAERLARETEACARSAGHAPARAIVCGGGRRNARIVAELRARMPCEVQTAEDAKWDGDAVEAQAFALLAARCDRSLPSSFPSTTGCPVPVVAGVRV